MDHIVTEIGEVNRSGRILSVMDDPGDRGVKNRQARGFPKAAAILG